MEALLEASASEAENVEKRDEKDLADVHLLTELIREHQKQIILLAKKRREKILRLRSHRITFREIAAAMKVTEQAVFKILQQAQDRDEG